MVAVVAALLGFAAGYLAHGRAPLLKNKGSQVEVTYRCFDPAEHELVRVESAVLPQFLEERLRPVAVVLEEEEKIASEMWGRQAVNLVVDPQAPSGQVSLKRGFNAFEEAQLSVESYEAPIRPSPGYQGAFHARVTYRLRAVVDECQNVAPLKDPFQDGWPGTCGYVDGDPRPRHLTRREYLIRREHFDQPADDGSRTVMELFEGRCVPLTALGHNCKLLGRSPGMAATFVVSVDAALSKLTVSACGGWASSGQLISRVPEAAGDADYARRDGDCFEYRLDVARMLERRSAFDLGGAVTLEGESWLWGAADQGEIRLRLELPEGVQASHPFTSVGKWLRVPPHAAARNFWLVLGRFERRVFQRFGVSYDVAIGGGPTGVDGAAIERWLGTAAQVVHQLHTLPPYGHVQVMVHAVPPGPPLGHDPVLLGRANRAGGPSNVLVIRRDVQESQLLDDWVAVHELLHHTLPFTVDGASWFNEGLSVYYEIALRARAGLITTREAIRQLRNGFTRLANATGDRSIREASEAFGRGAETVDTTRVYWGGVAVALAWDLALRRREGARLTLDHAMRHLAACCTPSERTWAPSQLLERLDRWAADDLFSRLANKALDRPGGPDTAPLLAALEADEALRKAILGPR